MISQELQQHVCIDGATLEYEVIGAGEPLVLVHGAEPLHRSAPMRR